MKRNVLCLFSFLLILLVFCTCVSPKIEEEMHTLVDARHGEAKGNRNLSIANIAIIWPNSDDVLFNIVEGTGWESGLQIAEIPSAYFDRFEGHVELGAGTDYWYLYSASREPVAGSPVTVVEETWKGDDIYLLWCPETIEGLDKLPNSMEVLTQTDNTALVSMRSATFPFFEHNIWYSLHDKMGDELRVYSICDVIQFTKAMPWIAGIAAVLLCSLILWGGSWFLYDKMGRKKGLFWLNILLIAGLLAMLPWLMGGFDLPASLMPVESILDISYYVENIGRVIFSLKQMGSSLLDEAAAQAIKQTALIISISLLTAVAVIGIQTCLVTIKRKGRKQRKKPVR